jgi:hypothetical protein
MPLVTAPNWKTTKCPSTREWLNTWGSIHSAEMSYNSKNELSMATCSIVDEFTILTCKNMMDAFSSLRSGLLLRVRR